MMIHLDSYFDLLYYHYHFAVIAYAYGIGL